MNILVLVYEGFAEFEMSLLGYVAVEEGHQVVTAAPDDTPVVRGWSGLKVTADLPLSKVDPRDYAALIIPGGVPESIIDRQEVTRLILRFHEAGKVLAAICMGPVHLAKAGVLRDRPFAIGASKNYRNLFQWENKADAPVVADGNIITAKDTGFVPFTFTVMEKLGAYRDPARAKAWREEFGV